MKHAFALVAIVAAAAGCGGKSKAQCKAEAAELGAYLGKLDTRMPLWLGKEVTLVKRAELAAVEVGRAPVLTVEEDGYRFMGSDVEEIEDVGLRLTAFHAKLEEDLAIGRYRKADRPDPAQIVVVIDARVRWERVVAVARTASTAGFTRPAFAFEIPPPAIEQPAKSRIDGELARIKDGEGGNKAADLAKLVSRVVGGCPALSKRFGAASEGPASGDLGPAMIAAIEPALLECNCAVDVAALRAIFFSLFYVEHPTSTVTIELGEGGRTVALAADTPWATASAQITAGTPMALAIAP